MMVNFFFFLLITLLLMCCNHLGEKESAASRLEGTYTRHVTGDFSVADDTLFIRAWNEQKNLFSIERRTGFHRITDAVVGPREWKQEASFGIWEERQSLLREQKFGRLYVLDDKGQSLSIGSSSYQRISK